MPETNYDQILELNQIPILLYQCWLEIRGSFNIQIASYSIGIPIIKITQSHDSLTFMLEIHTPKNAESSQD